MTRDELIKKCEGNVLKESEWHNRDHPDATEQLGKMWAYLKAGCDYKYQSEDDSVIIFHKTFNSIEWGSDEREEEWFYFLD